MNMRKFFNENFAEQAVILVNCPKGPKGTEVPLLGKSWVDNVGQRR